MAKQFLTQHATEQSTFPIRVVMRDGDGTLITPNDDIVWSLCDGEGNVINSRLNVAYSPPSSTVRVLLKGNDLLMQKDRSESEERCLVVHCTYDSDLDTGNPFSGKQWFYVDGVPVVTTT